jgi:site-specific DNA-methyltransferase (adenine-specific)
VHGTHHLLPLHADLLVRSRNYGFQALNGIIWNKLSNCNYEQGGGGYLGKPGQPNGVIKSELEHILFLKKPGPYRSPTPEQQAASRISPEEHAAWFRPIWSDIPGARATKQHPAPWPVEVPYRLIRMFSFVGDDVVDLFSGRFNTTVAAMRAGRNSIGLDIGPGYVAEGIRHAAHHARSLAA